MKALSWQLEMEGKGIDKKPMRERERERGSRRKEEKCARKMPEGAATGLAQNNNVIFY